MQRRAWFRAAAIAVVGTVTCSPSRGTDPAGRFFAVHNVMHAMGFFQAGPVNQGALAEGQEIKLGLTLPATCVAVARPSPNPFTPISAPGSPGAHLRVRLALHAPRCTPGVPSAGSRLPRRPV